MKRIDYLLLIFTILFINPNITFPQKYFSIGTKNFGIAFGNIDEYTGLRLNFLDINRGELVKGINISLLNQTYKNIGLNISILSGNTFNTGLNLSICNYSAREDRGVNISLLNITKGKAYGVNISLYSSMTEMNGLSINLINNITQVKGLEVGLINFSTQDKTAKCFCPGKIIGVQLGIINWTNYNKGLQIGLFNYTYLGKGLQIGLINIRRGNPWYCKVLPLINFKMDGNTDAEDDGVGYKKISP